MSNHRWNSYCTAIAFSLGVEFAAQAQRTSSMRLEQEVDRLMIASGWPRMIQIALDRGDLQRGAVGRLGSLSPTMLECLNQKYTQDRVLGKIRFGYLQLYADADIVAGITQFYDSQGGKQILDKIAERSKQVGAAAAYSDSKNIAPKSLTPEEATIFAKFANSPSGRAYLELRPTQLRIHQAQLTTLADEIAKECRE